MKDFLVDTIRVIIAIVAAVIFVKVIQQLLQNEDDIEL